MKASPPGTTGPLLTPSARGLHDGALPDAAPAPGSGGVQGLTSQKPVLTRRGKRSPELQSSPAEAQSRIANTASFTPARQRSLPPSSATEIAPVNMLVLPASIEDLQSDLQGAKERPVRKDLAAEVINDVRRQALVVQINNPAAAASNSTDLIKGISEQAVSKWIEAQGLAPADFAAMKQASFHAGIINPTGGDLGTVLSYVATPLIGALTGSPSAALAVGVSSAIVNPFINAYFQSGVVTRGDFIRERGGPTVALNKSQINDKETLAGVADKLKAHTKAFSDACTALKTEQAQHEGSDTPLSAQQHSEIKRLAEEVLSKCKTMCETQEQAIMTQGSHERQRVGNAWQALPRTMRPVGSGLVGLGTGHPEASPATASQSQRRTMDNVFAGSPPSAAPSGLPSGPPSALPSGPPSAMPSRPPSAMPSRPPSAMPSRLPSAMPSGPPSAMPSRPPSAMPSSAPVTAPETTSQAGRTAQYNGLTAAGIQTGVAAAVMIAHHYAAGRDEVNKQLFNNKLNMLHGDVFTPAGKAKADQGKQITAADIDEGKLRKLIVSPAQAFVARVAAEIKDQQESIRASMEKLAPGGEPDLEQGVEPLPQARQMELDNLRAKLSALDADLEKLNSGQLSELSQDGDARQLIQSSLQPFNSPLLRSALRIKYATDGEFSAQLTQRVGQAFHLGIAGSAVASVVGRISSAVVGGTANASTAQLLGVTAASGLLACLGANYQFAAISAKNYYRENVKTVTQSTQLRMGLQAMPLEITGQRATNEAIQGVNQAIDASSLQIKQALEEVNNARAVVDAVLSEPEATEDRRRGTTASVNFGGSEHP